MNRDASVVVSPSVALRGTISVPGDKSITHRALFFAALNNGRTTIVNRSPSHDCDRTLALVREVACDVLDIHSELTLRRRAVRDPRRDISLDCGNSGTTARLAMGLLAAEPGRFTLFGDESLTRRPMRRVAEPLRGMGARIATDGETLPAVIEGGTLEGGQSHGVIAVESAQVHAAIVLAALRSRAGAFVYVAKPMRDHTRRMLSCFGVDTVLHETVEQIVPAEIDRDVLINVPGDLSSAAFLIAGAVLVPDSEIVIEDVGLNPTRTAFLTALRSMGADVTVELTWLSYEPRGRITARHSSDMTAQTVGEHDTVEVAIGEVIDELPLLALMATQASGTTRIVNASELRVKESDRIASTVSVLRELGATVRELDDGLEIDGPTVLAGGCTIDPHGDHRLAMMAAVGGMIARNAVTIVNADVAAVSYPSFWTDLERLGASVRAI